MNLVKRSYNRLNSVFGLIGISRREFTKMSAIICDIYTKK